MEDDILIYTAIICLECNKILDVLSGKKDFLYVDNKCECGSVGFYTSVIKIKIICERPYGKKPFFELDGQEFYRTNE